MRLGCDLDGVLADLHTAFMTVAVRRYPHLDPNAMSAADIGASATFGEGPAKAPPDPAADTAKDANALPLSRDQLDVTWRELAATTDLWDTLDEIESGAVARLAALAETHRWEVIFLTSRPRSAGQTVQRQSQRWLARKGFTLPSVYVVHESRGRIADALSLDVVIDDRPDNCLDVVLESKARSVLIWRGPASTVPRSAKRLGIGVVSSVAACLDTLVEAQRSADTPFDLMQRLRRLLGLASKS